MPQRSTRRTPAPEELRLQDPTKRTPGSNALLPQRSSRRTPTTRIATKQGQVAKLPLTEVEEGTGLPDVTTTQDDDEGVATKKRKLSEAKGLKTKSTIPEVQVQDSQPIEPDLSVQPNSGAKRRKKRRSIGQQSMRPKPKNREPPIKGGRQPQRRVPKSELRLPVEPLDSPTTQLQQEVYDTIEAPAQADQPQQRESKKRPDTEGGRPIDAEEQGGTKSGKRKRKSVVVQPKKRLKSGKVNSKDIPRAQEEDHDPEPEASPILDRNPEAVPDSTGVAAKEQSMSLVDEEPRMKPKPKKRKRRSIGQQSIVRQKRKNEPASLNQPLRSVSNKKSEREPATQPKTRNVGIAAASRATARPRRRPQNGVSPIDEEDEHFPDFEPEASGLKKRRAHPTKVAAPPQPKRTATSKPSKPRPQKPKPQRQPPSPSPQAPPKNTIPITIYHPLSPVTTTSTSTPTSDVFSDPLTDPAQFHPAQPTLTAPSILSQMTRELLSKTTTSLTSLASANPNQRTVLQRRKKAVEAYGAELEARLIQLARAVGENEVLTRRVRERGKEERELRRKVAEVEEERERVRVRREEALKEREKGRLEGLLRGIKEVVKRGWEMEWTEKEVVLGD